MKKVFNTTGICVPEKHYMVNLSSRLNEVKALVEQGAYFYSQAPISNIMRTILSSIWRQC